MEALELYAKEFMKEKEKFDSMGYELIATNPDPCNDSKSFYTVRKKID
jgi:hypothetical protein